MKNFISLNIKYLSDKKNLSQDEFGLIFNLKKGVVGSYIREVAVPKLETIQSICIYFEISIDDFINKDLSLKPYGIRDGNLMMFKESEKEDYSPISPLYVEQLERTIQDKNDTIAALKESLKDKEKLIQTLEKKKSQNSA